MKYGPADLVGLGATCDVSDIATDGQSMRFAVSEFVELIDGKRVALRPDLGFAVGWGNSSSTDIVQALTQESVVSKVLTVVSPDEDDEEGDDEDRAGDDKHPWDWLAHLARDLGIDVTADDLRRLPYQVVLTERLTNLLEAPKNGRE